MTYQYLKLHRRIALIFAVKRTILIFEPHERRLAEFSDATSMLSDAEPDTEHIGKSRYQILDISSLSDSEKELYVNYSKLINTLSLKMESVQFINDLMIRIHDFVRRLIDMCTVLIDSYLRYTKEYMEQKYIIMKFDNDINQLYSEYYFVDDVFSKIYWSFKWKDPIMKSYYSASLKLFHKLFTLMNLTQCIRNGSFVDKRYFVKNMIYSETKDPAKIIIEDYAIVDQIINFDEHCSFMKGKLELSEVSDDEDEDE